MLEWVFWKLTLNASNDLVFSKIDCSWKILIAKLPLWILSLSVSEVEYFVWTLNCSTCILLFFSGQWIIFWRSTGPINSFLEFLWPWALAEIIYSKRHLKRVRNKEVSGFSNMLAASTTVRSASYSFNAHLFNSLQNYSIILCSNISGAFMTGVGNVSSCFVYIPLVNMHLSEVECTDRSRVCGKSSPDVRAENGIVYVYITLKSSTDDYQLSLVQQIPTFSHSSPLMQHKIHGNHF